MDRNLNEWKRVSKKLSVRSRKEPEDGPPQPLLSQPEEQMGPKAPAELGL